MAPNGPDADGRRAEILDAAVQVFLRYGFRKTSMDEVARAAGLSRPGLYLHFSSKELLFQAAIAHLLDQALDAVRRALADGSLPLQERIVSAFSAYYGPYVGGGLAAQHSAELIESAEQLAAGRIAAHESAVRVALIDAIQDGFRTGAPNPLGLEPRELADLLDLVASGLKYRAATLDEFTDRLRSAADLLCRSRTL